MLNETFLWFQTPWSCLNFSRSNSALEINLQVFWREDSDKKKISEVFGNSNWFEKYIFVSFKLCYLEVQSRKTPKCIVHMKQRNYVKLYPVQNLNIQIFTQCKLVNSDKPVLLSKKPCVLWIGRVFANLAPHKSKLSAI